jgi:hypothetical protein
VRSYVRKLFVLASAATLSAVALPAARSAPGLPIPKAFSEFKVNDLTPEQQAEVEELRALLASRGMDTSDIGVYVVPEVDGPTTYVTRSPQRFEARIDGDVYKVVPTAEALPAGLRKVGTIVPLSAEPSWALNNEDCFRVAHEPFARWVCWEIDEQHGDSDHGRHYWQFTQEATGSAEKHRKMKRLWVEGKPHEKAAPMRFDGIPEPKETSKKADACETRSDTISVSGGKPVSVGFSRTWNRVTCERYEIKDYNDHGHWATIWEGKPVGHDDARHVIFTMPISTVEGQLPMWHPWSGQRKG